jgi:hypothetical protein
MQRFVTCMAGATVVVIVLHRNTSRRGAGTENGDVEGCHCGDGEEEMHDCAVEKIAALRQRLRQA